MVSKLISDNFRRYETITHRVIPVALEETYANHEGKFYPDQNPATPGLMPALAG